MKAEVALLFAEIGVMLSDMDTAMDTDLSDTDWIPEGRRGPWKNLPPGPDDDVAET